MFVRWDLYGSNQEHLMLYNREQRQLYLVANYAKKIGKKALIELAADATKDEKDMSQPVASQVLARLADPKTRPLVTVMDHSQLLSLSGALNSVMLLGTVWLATPAAPPAPARRARK